jgi:hypothetical protein
VVLKATKASLWRGTWLSTGTTLPLPLVKKVHLHADYYRNILSEFMA